MTRNTISIPAGSTISDFISAFESIGFTNDSTVQTATTAELYWGKDTEHHFKLFLNIPASGNCTGYLRDATYTNTTNIGNYNIFVIGAVPMSSSMSTVNASLDYVTFKTKTTDTTENNIIFGIRPDTVNIGYRIAFIQPVASTDQWLLIFANGYGSIYDYGCRTALNYDLPPVGNLRRMDIQTGVVQLIKPYLTSRFIDNLYISTIHPSITTFALYNVTVGSKTFLVWSVVGNSYSTAHMAFDISADITST